MGTNFNAISVKATSMKFQSTIALDSIQIASPCHADWNQMIGDEQTRFCRSCQKNVYNLSSMSRENTEALLLEKEGRVCVRFYQREDGSMLTQDCPIGIEIDARLQPRFALWSKVCALTLLAGAILGGTAWSSTNATQGAPVMGRMFMGAVAPPPLSTKTARPLMVRVAPRKVTKRKPVASSTKKTAKNVKRGRK
jgi:hypothetical protein